MSKEHPLGTVTDLSTGITKPLQEGRPSGLTADVHERIVANFRENPSPKAVAAACNVALSTLHRWLQKGRAGHPTYEKFAKDVAAARSLHMAKWMENVERIAEGDSPHALRANLTLLARMFPDEWGDRDTVALDEHKSKKSAAERLAALPPEKRERARELIKLLGSGDDE